MKRVIVGAKPYMGVEAEAREPVAQVEAEGEPARPRLRADLLNLVVIAAGWGLLLLLVPPQHEYPIIDDWIYAGSVRDMLQTGRFIMPAASQANLVGQTVWGALWASLFGFSFTTLTYSTLFMAVVGLFAFYGIARLLDVPPWGALFGTALLGLNPMFVHLSYSFMTDMHFLALALVACYCYIRGIQRDRLAWLLAGGCFAAWAFLVRQFAALVPAAFIAYLAVEALRSRRWNWRRALQMLAIALAPALAFAFWYVWIRTPVAPMSMPAQAAARSAAFVLKEPWLRVFLLRAFAILPLTALFAWGALKIPRSRWWLVPLMALAMAWTVYAVDLPEETWLAVTTPPFTARLGPLAIELPHEPFSFGGVGNIFRVGGIDFFEYDQQPIWTHEAWWAIWLVGAALAVLLVTKIVSALYDWLRRRSVTPRPLAAMYLLGAAIFVASLAFPGDLFDRYALGFLPFVILFVVRGSREWGRVAWAYSVAGLVVLATFTVLVKLDNISHNEARWEAGRWMQQRVGAVQVGFDWNNWMGLGNHQYRVADVPLPGFRVERQFPYLCRLCGFTTRFVLAQSRVDMPPLPEP